MCFLGYFLLLFISSISYSNTQDVGALPDARVFPPLINIANKKPISTEPSSSTCGIPLRHAYCKSSTYPSSISNCAQEFCDQTCPTRESVPDPLDLLTGNQIGNCIVLDRVNTRPQQNDGDFSKHFMKRESDGSGTLCFLEPLLNPSLGTNGAFTITFWVWQQLANSGTIFEKMASSALVLSLSMSTDGVRLTYMSPDTQLIASIQFNVTFTQNAWNFMAIQVYGKVVSIFINGLSKDLAATETKTLLNPLKDGSSGGKTSIRIGQDHAGTSQFLGRLQDLNFYGTTLSNREIAEIYSGLLPEVRFENLCRCPASHPRLKSDQIHICIENSDNPQNVLLPLATYAQVSRGVVADSVLRLNVDAHPLGYANDGDSNTMWVSAVQDTVKLTVDLQDEFQVFYVVLQFYSPLPQSVIIERQSETLPGIWQRWQLYADDCPSRFEGMMNNGQLSKPNSVNCIQLAKDAYSKGNITLNLLSTEPVMRPGYNSFYRTPELQDFVAASKIRVTMYGHMSIRSFRHRYYGVYEYIVSARCQCNGHASKCNMDPLPYSCICHADSFTTGRKCEHCLPLYNNKPYQRGDHLDAYPCQPCQCHNHADSCVYNFAVDPFPSDAVRGGGGVCVNCMHHTTGRHCEMCDDFYFRPLGISPNDEAACHSCDCNLQGTVNGLQDCEKIDGQCLCKVNVHGRQCDQCRAGFYQLLDSNVDGCQTCDCNSKGTGHADGVCDSESGQCSCKANVQGLHCDQCTYGYFNLSESNPRGCTPCDCNPRGSSSRFCDPANGQCQCKPKTQGRQCNDCVDGFYDFSRACVACECDPDGTVSGTVCNKTDGSCICKSNVEGMTCDTCILGTFNFGNSVDFGCTDCACDAAGILPNSSVCDVFTGLCECKPNVMGRTCNLCKGNTWGLDFNNTDGCISCNCDITGTQGGDTRSSDELSCNHNTGQCTCLTNRFGIRCDQCELGFYKSTDAAGGCLRCQCDSMGAIPLAHCDAVTGQCQCQGDGSGITGIGCDQCLPGFYNFQQRYGRCTTCLCHSWGSMNDSCNPATGHCSCKLFTQGLQCEICMDGTSNLQQDNPYGCSKAPAQQPQVVHEAFNDTTLRLYWQPPDYANGVIVQYFLYRNGSLIADINPDVREFVDTGLKPYTIYSYVVEPVNSEGSAKSRAANFRTLPGIPAGEFLLNYTDVGAQMAAFTWNPPSIRNGPIIKYFIASQIVLHDESSPEANQTAEHWQGIGQSATILHLQAFTRYAFFVHACTDGGCLQSQPVIVTTTSAPPQQQPPPKATLLDAFTLYLSWDSPIKPNGVIIFYELWMRRVIESGNETQSLPASRIFHPSGQFYPHLWPTDDKKTLPPPATNYTVTGLLAFSLYEFQVIVENDAGKAASQWVRVRTGEAVPKRLPTPVVSALSSVSLRISWSEPVPVDAQGHIIQYTIYQLINNEIVHDPFAPPTNWELLQRLNAKAEWYVIDTLVPYTDYSFKLEMCNSIGCVNSSVSHGQTDMAAPEGLRNINVHAINSSAVHIIWQPPLFPNGPEPEYSVERMSGALNAPPQMIRGARFPGKGYYSFPSNTLPQNVDFTGLDLWFRTRQRDGLILFAVSPGQQDEFILLQLNAGRPRFVFDAQRCPAVVITTNDEGLPFNDSRWHHLKIMRLGKQGNVVVDNVWKGVIISSCELGNVIGPNTGVYIGGIPKNFVFRRNFGEFDERATPVKEGYQGCMRDIKILRQRFPVEIWEPLDWDNAKSNELSFPSGEGCPINLEVGYHFLGQGFASVISSEFTGGDEFSVAISIRTELHSGVLLFMHGARGVYVLAQMVNGSIYYEFSDSISREAVIYESGGIVNFCDGQFRNIIFSKVGGEATITVRDAGSRSSGQRYIDFPVITVSDVFIGGIPPKSEIEQFVTEHNIPVLVGGFGGCIHDIVIDGFRLQYKKIIEVLNVKMDGCPPYRSPDSVCSVGLTDSLYNGTETLFNDTNLHAYTEYMYRVEAHNKAGRVQTPWMNIRTNEGVPSGVEPPFALSSPASFNIFAQWNPPVSTSGLITRYILRAYNVDTPKIPVQETIIDDGPMEGLVENLTPYTRYNVTLTACTSGGCQESDTATNIVTMEDVPEDLAPPSAAVAAPTFLVLKWMEPNKPNGVITGYLLYMEGEEIYAGGEKIFNLTELREYTAYTFMLSACTSIGCTRSPDAIISTGQLPPAHVPPPRLQPLGVSSMEVTWEKPENRNGILRRYLIYMSKQAGIDADVVYNSTDLFLSAVLTNLTAGTLYFVALGACTDGGCQLSVQSNVTTEEASPESVLPPTVISPHSSTLQVFWREPALPNGKILYYEIYHNGVKILTSNTVGNHTISGLLPFELHAFRLVACTSYGCGYSLEAKVRTQEAPPQGWVILDSRVVDSRNLDVKWTEPETANGLLLFTVYCKGLFYSNKGHYATVVERRSLYNTSEADKWMRVENLLPFTGYLLQVNASNSKGFLLSNTQNVTMPSGSPDGVQAPMLEATSTTSVTVTWYAVGRDNSIEPPYFILQFRKSQYPTAIHDVFGPTTSLQFVKDGLQAFTKYEFRVLARNNYGTTVSPWSVVVSKQGKPDFQGAPEAVEITSRYIGLTWPSPVTPNGNLLKYNIYQNNILQQEVLGGTVTKLHIRNLTPDSEYSFEVESCTVAGCTRSDPSASVKTKPAKPEGLQPLLLNSITATSVQITWSLPSSPNGYITQFIIERRLTGSNLSVIIADISAGIDIQTYLDDDLELNPFTEYQYRLKVINAAGVGVGEWTAVVTNAARPGGIASPEIIYEEPRLLHIKWQPPVTVNGKLELYVLRLPIPRLEIRDINQTMAIVRDLTPFTEYSITIAACTAAGCTESPILRWRTHPTMPSDQALPVATPQSQNLITVMWTSPAGPNGPNVQYELSRMKVKQPLIPSPADLGVWQQVYTGIEHYYEDRGLPLYTTYKYRITTYNDYGHVISKASESVTTHGGQPTQGPNITVTAQNHTTIFVDWETPSVSVLQGDVVSYTVSVFLTSNTTNATAITEEMYDPIVTSATLTGLMPNTKYSVLVRVTINGGAAVASDTHPVLTMDGAPFGMKRPEVIALDDYSLRVSWDEPLKSNGDITSYTLIVNDERIAMTSQHARSHVLTKLQPYVPYLIQVEVCTVFDCLTSDPTATTTRESRPNGLDRPYVTVQSESTALITWDTPSDPNGLIHRYELMRQTVISCATRKTDVESSGEQGQLCAYIQCSHTHHLCGETCYSGAKVCCSGKLYDYRRNHECCHDNYLPQNVPGEDAVCCGGKFHGRKMNYDCCDGRYVEIMPDQVCCSDPAEDRIAIGYGDTCCSAIPYRSSGPQICCAGILRSQYGLQCCNGHMVDESLVCCGNASLGELYIQHSNKTCCGLEYTDVDTSLCCTSGQHTMLYAYDNTRVKAEANEKCCGSERIMSWLSCCNYVAYDSLSQTCADVSNTNTGCGNGTVCPISQAESAFCNECHFNRERYSCTAVKSTSKPEAKPNIESLPSSSTIQDSDVVCYDEAIQIYSGMGMEYQDFNLKPYTVYEYAVIVYNGASNIMSEYTSARTMETVPENVLPPTAKIWPHRLYTINLTWKLPDQPNGVITEYILKRDDSEIYRGLGQEYVDDATILPYRSYTYRLTACNNAGCSSSNLIRVATAEAGPEGVFPPIVRAVSATEVELEWSSPETANGIIILYSIIKDGVEPVCNVTEKPYICSVMDLKAHVEYSWSLRVCTRTACTNSEEVSLITPQAPPTGLSQPRFIILNNSSAELTWTPPSEVNGIMEGYNIYQQQIGDDVQLVFSGDKTALSYTASDTLTPGNQYKFHVEAVSGGGGRNSSAVQIIMPDVTPLYVPKPDNVTVLGASSIFIKWSNFTAPGDVIDQYRVLLQDMDGSYIEKGIGTEISTIMMDLRAYHEYVVRIQACLLGIDNGCGTGPPVIVRTSEMAPSGQRAPVVISRSLNVIYVKWEEPEHPNGVIIKYLVHQRQELSLTPLLINRINGEVFDFHHAGADLMPYTEYQYQITAVNSHGEAISPWTTVLTQEALPEQMNKPEISAVGPHSVSVQWSPPVKPNGVIITFRIEYRLTHNLIDELTTKIYTVLLPGGFNQTVVGGLKPFTDYEICVVAMNKVGAIRSEWVQVRTREAAPSQLGVFDIEKLISGSGVILRWPLPGSTNGILTEFKIFYGNSEEQVKASEVPVYQGLDRQFELLRLLPFTNYWTSLQACTMVGCVQSSPQRFTTDDVIPSLQGAPSIGNVTSTYVVVTWEKPHNPNGRVISYEVLRSQIMGNVERMLTESVVVYKTVDGDMLHYEYVDFEIRPYTAYEYIIRTANSRGSTDSPQTRVITPQAPPDGLDPPVISHVLSSALSLSLTWRAPTHANGLISGYQLQRNNSVPLSFSSSKLSYIDRELSAFTTYSYTITACTGGGCRTSEPAHLTTKEAPPLLVLPPQISPVNSTTLSITWTHPYITTGEITQYSLEMDGRNVYHGQSTTYELTELNPFQEYTFKLLACTNGGCTQSSETVARTTEAPPLELAAPVLMTMTSTSVQITWQAPSKSNGVITIYEVYRGIKLVFTESLSAAGTLRTSYLDFDLIPGTTYTYTIIARNSKGSVDSPGATVRTLDSSPNGLHPPSLVPVSPTSIRAIWQPPSHPNGNILNYTLFLENKHIYSGDPKRFQYTVSSLAIWTEYTLRVQACTSRGCEISGASSARTLAANPKYQSPPVLLALTDHSGASSGVHATWNPPKQPNGEIIEYQLLRRAIIASKYDANAFSDSLIVYNGTLLSYTDRDPSLKPYQYYQYAVSAVNEAGHASSVWQEIQTHEGYPAGIPEPTILSMTVSTLTVQLYPPEEANGIIRLYRVLLNNSMVSETTSFNHAIDVGSLQLQPYTWYAIQAEACTAPGCSRSIVVMFRTDEAVPEGMTPVQLTSVYSSGVALTWRQPTKQNGQITRYNLWMRRSCPLSAQPFRQQCTFSKEPLLAYSGANTSHTLSGLDAYMAYDFRITAENSAGLSNIPEWTHVITQQKEPDYVEFPILSRNGTQIVVDWSHSFRLNGRLLGFMLHADGAVIYHGVHSLYSVEAAHRRATIQFVIYLITEVGTAETPKIAFDPNTNTFITSPDPPPAGNVEKAFYEEIWFIVVMCLLSLVVLALVIILCLKMKPKTRAYIREKYPLQRSKYMAQGDSMSVSSIKGPQMVNLPPAGSFDSLAPKSPIHPLYSKMSPAKGLPWSSPGSSHNGIEMVLERISRIDNDDSFWQEQLTDSGLMSSSETESPSVWH